VAIDARLRYLVGLLFLGGAAYSIPGYGAGTPGQPWSASQLEEVVRSNVANGYAIDVISVSGHERVVPTKGGPGAYVDVSQARSLLQGKTNIKQGERIILYPYTEATKVIVLTMDVRNWLPYSEAIEGIINGQLEQLGAR
jgi:hypothetical protein